MGGQAVNAWDYDLALGVHYTFEKALITNLQKYIEDLQLLPEDFDMSTIKDLVRKYRTAPNEPIHYAEHPTDELRDILTRVVGECQYLSEYGILILSNSEDMIIQQSIDDTIDETYQAMEAAIHNLNTLHCLPGSEEIWVREVGSRKWKLITMKELNDTFEENKYVVHSVNMTTGRIESKKVLASAKQDKERALVTITVDDNTGSKAVTRSVTVTTNHKIITSVDDEYCKDYPMNSVTIVTKSGNNMTVALPISAKTMSNSGKEYVYDISVEDNENFMTKDGLFVSNSRAGSQVPFSSINFGTDTSDAGRLITRKTLEAVDAGMGNGETAIFPISIFKVYDGINFKPGDPNYDLYRYAMEVTARRLFPNFVFGDAPYNYQYYKPGHPETEIVAMGQ